MNPHKNKLMRLILALLSEGITPHKIALTLALGVMLGATPVLGTTTILCAAAAVIFRLNLPLIQAVNFLVYPLQLLLLIPFIDIGQWLFHQSSLPFTLTQLKALLHQNFWHTLGLLWNYSLHGVVAWLIFGGLGAVLIYLVLYPILALVLAKRTSADTPGSRES